MKSVSIPLSSEFVTCVNEKRVSYSHVTWITLNTSGGACGTAASGTGETARRPRCAELLMHSPHVKAASAR